MYQANRSASSGLPATVREAGSTHSRQVTANAASRYTASTSQVDQRARRTATATEAWSAPVSAPLGAEIFAWSPGSVSTGVLGSQGDEMVALRIRSLPYITR